MGDDEQRRVLEQVFGYSSSERDEDEPLEGGGGRRWEKVEEVKGLWLCREFLDPEQQSWLLSSIDQEELDGVPHQDTEEICPLPFDLLCREPLFDQLIANSYEPGEGICAHVDLMQFEDGIAIVSLRSPCIMHFTRVKQEGVKNPATRVPVLLSPGSLVVMSGEARYLWKHEINRKPGFQLWEGKEIVQQHRTSVTLRKLRTQA